MAGASSKSNWSAWGAPRESTAAAARSRPSRRKFGRATPICRGSAWHSPIGMAKCAFWKGREINMARPKAKIDLSELEKLCGLQCTDAEIAAFFGVSARTIERRRQVQKFADVMERSKLKGKVSV